MKKEAKAMNWKERKERYVGGFGGGKKGKEKCCN